MKNRAWYWFCRWLCRFFCAMCWKFRVYDAKNVPQSGGLLLASNHQSYLDPVLCGVGLPRRLNFLARDTLFINPVFRVLIKSLNAIPVKRGQSDLAAMKEVISRCKQGKIVCLYPEGTRTETGKIAPAKPGFGLLARRANVPIVPMVIEGAFDHWPKGKSIFSIGGRISICYDKPIWPEQVKKMTEKQLAQLLTSRLRIMQNKLRMRHGQKPFDYSRGDCSSQEQTKTETSTAGAGL